MRIILSPAKKMNVDTDTLEPLGMPEFLDRSAEILEWMRRKSPAELQAIWKCNDKIAELNLERIRCMDLQRQLTPAILAYEGIAFQYMGPAVFDYEQLAYVQEHLRILSAFYGLLRPMDGVTPYRLEMAAKATVAGSKDLYEYWGRALYEGLRGDGASADGGDVIINLASKEYSKCISKYLQPSDRFITITFCEMAGGKLVTKGTYAKMARGEMVRYMAERNIKKPEEIKDFNRLGYVYRDELSSETEFVFERIS